MYEGAAYASKMIRSEQMNDVLIAEAAAQNGIPHNVVHEFVQQQDGRLPAAQRDTGSMWQRMFGNNAEERLQAQQFERMQQQAGIEQAASIHAAAIAQPHQPLVALQSQVARLGDWFRGQRQEQGRAVYFNSATNTSSAARPPDVRGGLSIGIHIGPR